MHIAFLSPSHIDFTPHTPRIAPLGGSESAACHIATALAARGHRVTLLANTSTPGVYDNVDTQRWGGDTPEGLAQLQALKSDIAILLRLAPKVLPLKSALPSTPLLLWAQDDPAQSSIQPLANPQVQEALAAVINVSTWQRDEFLHHFHLPLAKCHILPNPIGPSFESLFTPNDAILSHKPAPPILAYTSTPFRGLNILLDIFPHLRAAVPGLTLKVFSSMQVYQLPAAQDLAAHANLYDRCRTTEGVQYVGSIPQPALAAELKSVTALAYPNAFPETSCIAALEAMAAGLLLVSSHLAALPETTAGYAQLLPLGPGYRHRYTQTLLDTLQRAHTHRAATESHLQRQRAHVLTHHAPAALAPRWEALLQSCLAR